VKPILFILGPSGVGKSYLSEHLRESGFLYEHFDTDRASRSFAAKGFPGEWDDDFQKVNVSHLVATLRDRVNKEHAGAVVSFPTTYVFKPATR
jgi:adenylate kinase family enzyme